MLTSGGDLDPAVETRVFWAVTEGLVAAALLLAGEEALSGLQAGAVSAGLPVRDRAAARDLVAAAGPAPGTCVPHRPAAELRRR